MIAALGLESSQKHQQSRYVIYAKGCVAPRFDMWGGFVL